jgi:succinoglycan biosynthesis protein ExoU
MTDSPQSKESSGVRQIGKAVITCVDVLIAARDRAESIERAVMSAIAQNEVRTVIVVDDGSLDDTAARARRCDPTGQRVIVERLRSSVGPAAARNVAIKISTAPWLAVLDADDFFLPGRIEAMLLYSDNCDLVADKLVHIPEDRLGHELLPSIQVSVSTRPASLRFEQFALGNVTRRGSHREELGYLQPLMRRGFLDSHALRYDEALRFGEDYALYARALAAGARFVVIPTAGYVAVERADSLSSRHTRRDLEMLRNSDQELLAMGQLTPSERDAVARHCADLDRRAQWLVLVETLQARDFSRSLSTLLQSPDLTLYLLRRLVAELPLQIRRRLRGS